MEFKIPISKEEKYNWIIDIMSCLKPFSELRPREREVLAEIYRLNEELSNIPDEQRSLLLAHSENKKKMAVRVGETGITVDSFYNIVMALKKKGMLEGERNEISIPKIYIDRLTKNNDSIKFNFIFTDAED